MKKIKSKHIWYLHKQKTKKIKTKTQFQILQHGFSHKHRNPKKQAGNAMHTMRERERERTEMKDECKVPPSPKKVWL